MSKSSVDEGIYLKIFDGRESVESNFETTLDADVNILLAFYEYEDYEGDAYVLFEQQGQLFEVHGSHCSCYGLENQWEPEIISLEYLQKNTTYKYGYSEEYKRVVDKLANEQISETDR